MEEIIKEIYITLLDGTLNYYSAIHENIDVKMKEDKSHLIGDSYVEAAVFGGGKAYFRLRQNINLINRNGKWLINSSKASIY